MDNRLKKIINEQFNRTLNEHKKYTTTRKLVENMVRETLLKRMNENKNNVTRIRKMLNDPSINKSGLARKISGLSGNDDTRRSEISKIARGKWIPDEDIYGEILHTLTSDK